MDFDSSIYEAVKTIIDEWYPHGLVSCCCASVHEFGAEAAMIAVRIEPNMNVRQISAVISDVFNTQNLSRAEMPRTGKAYFAQH